ncbi:pyridoxal phosphate-dependent aminotransferase [Mesoterricola sediminis]|uniref:Aspartate aminotransferase n=1 Tax=Mesoterricola sediminis TaxID=2927980 RepID=A0AA48HCE2_9BACT|nr:pyridoxal phosphate-dependent aminotransferase [Mesoterricola sediminis]BDU75708.1 aspartate aminotransferase [Mesoterricola sediminis]
MSEHLVPSRRGLPGNDPIFALDAEARRRKLAGETVVNATLGALTGDDGRLVILEPVMRAWADLTPAEVAPYAPIAGDPAFLDALVARHWPGEACRSGCATPGGSGALGLSARAFLEPGMAVLAAGPCWGPYRTLAGEAGCGLVTAPFPEPGRPLDLAAWEAAASALLARQGRLLVWLNDPCHNPTGRSLSAADRQALHGLLEALAARGPATLLLDLAYQDYTPDPAHVRAALDDHARLGRAGRVLAGACLSLSKALTLYGGRGGALAFPWTDDADLRAALGACCRGLWSNAPRAPQAVLLRLLGDPALREALAAAHRTWSEILRSRAAALDAAMRAEGLDGITWQGGFFTALPGDPGGSLAARLKDQGVFVVPLPEGMRVGLCALRADEAPSFARALKAASSLV